MKVLLDNLWFANGVALPSSEDFVVVAESHSSRIMKVFLKGEQKGKKEIFIDGLPGAPDNLSYDEEGIWVPLASAADESHPMIPHLLAEYPKVRLFTVRLLELVEMPFRFINSVYPNPITHAICRNFMSMDMISYILPPRRTIIRLDWDGKVIKSYHGSDKSSGVITHVLKREQFLYLGSVTSDFISRVKA